MKTLIEDAEKFENKLNNLLKSIDQRLGTRKSHYLNSDKEKKSPEKFIPMIHYFWIGWYGDSGILGENQKFIKIMILENGWVFVLYGEDWDCDTVSTKRYPNMDILFSQRLQLIKFLISIS